jgi:hypothetical protein
MKLALDTAPKKRRGKNGLTIARFQCTRRMLELVRKEAEDRGENMSEYMRGVISLDLQGSSTRIEAC